MPDAPEAPAVEPDQPNATETPDAPDQSTGSQEESFTDAFKPADLPEELRPTYEEAYRRLQSDYSKKTGDIAQERQEAQELREFAEAMQDPATRDAILEQQFGYQFEDGGEEEFLDPEEELRARLEAVEGTLTAQQQEFVQEQQTSQALDRVAEGIAELEKSWGDGFEFEGKTLKAVQAYAEVHGPEAIPEIGEAMREIAESQKQNWIDSKKSPRRISQGTPASKTVEPKDRGERMEMALEAMEDAEASG